MKARILGMVAVGLASIPLAANALTLNFVRITNNSSSNVANQLTVDVSDAGGGLVNFKFFNNVGVASSITDVYFDDGTLLGIASITNSAGVAFSSPANPGDLPGGQGIFETTQGFSADSDTPIMANGVNAASEWVTVTFSLINGKTYADTLAALLLGSVEGGLRIGMHVQAIGTDGQSDGYINIIPDEPRPPVPEPGTLALLGLGLVGLGFSRSRRNG